MTILGFWHRSRTQDKNSAVTHLGFFTNFALIAHADVHDKVIELPLSVSTYASLSDHLLR